MPMQVDPLAVAARSRAPIAALVLLGAFVLAACSAAAPSASAPGGGPSASGPSATIGPSASGPAATTGPSGAASPISADEAVRRVLALDPRFAGIGPRDLKMVGQSSWYDVKPGTVGWTVTISIGWGDCPAGCINHRTWVYAVAGDGAPSLVSQSGDELPAASNGLPAGNRWPIKVPTDGGPWLVGRVTASPVCPVESNPPDPACEPRVVGGATIVVRGAAGNQVGSAVTDAAGVYRVAVPAGSYTIVASPVQGLLGIPAPAPAVVPAGAGAFARVDLSYDTGIR